jgi:hypothetical protein
MSTKSITTQTAQFEGCYVVQSVFPALGIRSSHALNVSQVHDDVMYKTDSFAHHFKPNSTLRERPQRPKRPSLSISPEPHANQFIPPQPVTISTMRLSTIITFTAALFITTVTSLACVDGTKYCSHTLRRKGKRIPSISSCSANNVIPGWSEDNIWEHLESAGLRPGFTKAHIQHALFKCEDHWYWANAHLHYVDWCQGGCIDNGVAKDDSCKVI